MQKKPTCGKLLVYFCMSVAKKPQQVVPLSQLGLSVMVYNLQK